MNSHDFTLSSTTTGSNVTKATLRANLQNPTNFSAKGGFSTSFLRMIYVCLGINKFFGFKEWFGKSIFPKNPDPSLEYPRIGFFGFQSHPKNWNVGGPIPFLGHTNGFLGINECRGVRFHHLKQPTLKNGVETRAITKGFFTWESLGS